MRNSIAPPNGTCSGGAHAVARHSHSTHCACGLPTNSSSPTRSGGTVGLDRIVVGRKIDSRIKRLKVDRLHFGQGLAETES